MDDSYARPLLTVNVYGTINIAHMAHLHFQLVLSIHRRWALQHWS